jgi:hypothetical protein
MDASYNVDEWAGGTTRGRHVFNYNFHLVGDEFKGRKLLKVVPMEGRQQLKENVSIWQSKADSKREMVRISVAERNDWRAAQERLQEELNHSMRPNIPRGTGKLAVLGDVNFVARDPVSDVAAAISFTRGNVFVLLASVGERNVDVSEFAAHLDRLLSEPPSRAELDKGRVRVRAPKAVTVGTGQAYVLIENLPATASRGQWLKIIAPDGELTSRGDALIYSSPQGGKKQIGIFVMRKA